MRWLRAINSMLFMRCRSAAALISHAMDRRLDPEDRAALGVHLAICSNCRRYRRQLALLRRLLPLVELRPPASVCPLSTEARTRIRVALEVREPER
jgi:predicted anti-sigma-YlaC factor YlaD